MVASCFFWAAMVAVNFSLAAASSRILLLVSSCSPARSRRARLASEIASSEVARASATLSFSFSVLLMSFFKACSFCAMPARLASAAAFCLLRSVGLAGAARALPPSARESNSARVVFTGTADNVESNKTLLRLTLVGHGGGGGSDGSRVAQVVMADRFQVGIEFVDQGLAVGNVQADDVFVADPVEHLDQGAQAVAVGGNQNLAAGADRRRNFLVPGRHHARHRVLQAFGQGNLAALEAGVAGIGERGALVGFRQRRRRGVVAAAPDQHLRIAIFGGRFSLV